MSRTASMVLLLAAILAGGLGADTIHLVGGGSIEGKVVSETDTAVEVELAFGKMTVSRERIATIERGPSPLETYEARRAKIEYGDAEGHFELGVWCREHGLSREASAEFAHAIQFDPEHGEAHRFLGQIQVGGAWFSPGEYREHMEAQGLVLHGGRWMPKVEAEALVREEEARRERALLQAEVNRLVHLMGSPSARVRKDAYDALVALGEENQIAGMAEAAARARAYYERILYERSVVTMEIHAQNAGPTEFRRVTTTLGSGSPVTIELPSHEFVGVDTTVAVPAGGR